MINIGSNFRPTASILATQIQDACENASEMDAPGSHLATSAQTKIPPRIQTESDSDDMPIPTPASLGDAQPDVSEAEVLTLTEHLSLDDAQAELSGVEDSEEHSPCLASTEPSSAPASSPVSQITQSTGLEPVSCRACCYNVSYMPIQLPIV